MLRIDLRLLKDGPVPTELEVAADDPAIADLGAHFLGPVRISGRLQATAGEDFLWRAEVDAKVAGECRRCLAPVEQEIRDTIEVVFSSNPELLDDPSVYELPLHPVAIDLSAPVREELALRIPAFVLCRPECRGLCAVCGADLNAGACEHATGSTN